MIVFWIASSLRSSQLVYIGEANDVIASVAKRSRAFKSYNLFSNPKNPNSDNG